MAKRFRIPLTKPLLNDDVKNEVWKVLDSGFITEGEKAREFERLVADYCNRRHGIVVPNATIGLELVLRAMEPLFGDMDEVIVPAFTHPATILAILNAGMTAVVVDVKYRSMLISGEEIEAAINDRTAAVMPVSLFGNPVDYRGIFSRLRNNRRQIYLIEDAACSLGSARSNGEIPVGMEPDAAVFSFHPRKNITTGEGGMIVTDNTQVVSAVEALKNFSHHSCSSRFHYGSNYRMTDFQAAMGVAQMRILDEIVLERRKVAEMYDNAITERSSDRVSTVFNEKSVIHNAQTYCVRVNGDRDRIMNRMRDKGIEAQIGSYYINDFFMFHAHPNCRLTSCPVAKQVSDEALALPLYGGMTSSEVNEVVDELIPR